MSGRQTDVAQRSTSSTNLSPLSMSSKRVLVNTQYTHDELENDHFIQKHTKNEHSSSSSAFVSIDSLQCFEERLATAGTRLVLCIFFTKLPLFTRIELENIARTYNQNIIIFKCDYSLQTNKHWIETIATRYNKRSSLEHMENYCVCFLERCKLVWPHVAFRTPLLMEDEDELFGPFVNDWFVLSQQQEKAMTRIFGRSDFHMFGFMHKRGMPPPRDFIPASSEDLLRRPQMVAFLVANASSVEVDQFFVQPLKELYALLKQQYHEYALEVLYIPFDNNKKLFMQSTKLMPWLLLPYEDTEIKAHVCKVFNVNKLPALFLTNLNQEFHYIEANELPNASHRQKLLDLYQIWRKILVPKIRRHQPIPFEYIEQQEAAHQQQKQSASSPKRKSSNQLPVLSSVGTPPGKKQFPSYLSIFQKNIKLLFPNLLITRDKKTFRTFDKLRQNKVLGLLFANPEQMTKKSHSKFLVHVSRFYDNVRKNLDPNGFEIIYVPYSSTQREMFTFMHQHEMNFLALPFDVAAEYREVLERMFQVFVTPKFLVLNIQIRGGAYQVGVDATDNFAFILKQYKHLYLKWIRDLDVQATRT